ncbi:hypothetical protein ACOQFV_30260 [Nocardiopsis changdeensis]|uniref:Uncharacterized protein n=1 Tax=Nocardiopsis changdeensis TaxID=2831969 RepID=A0ABX8BIE8_9ACTN|nr:MULTISPECIES: hypothetical protein [Nocardiopsis]QUX20721.1 hypothetical protein KGD84_19775 [Nocardiopsis changdeensis]QYX36653.1 hypothetical protein K1J57_29230 [Nocardiopsis sp. MT53]
MDREPPLVREVPPELVAELAALLEAEGERDLAIVAHDIRLVRACECADDFCQSFYTADHPRGTKFSEGHRTVALMPEVGMLHLDVVFGRIVYVEVLGRPPLRAR